MTPLEELMRLEHKMKVEGHFKADLGIFHVAEVKNRKIEYKLEFVAGKLFVFATLYVDGVFKKIEQKDLKHCSEQLIERAREKCRAQC